MRKLSEFKNFADIPINEDIEVDIEITYGRSPSLLHTLDMIAARYKEGRVVNIVGGGFHMSTRFRIHVPEENIPKPETKPATMDFSQALIELKTGKKVARSGWNGKKPNKLFIPKDRKPIVYEGLCYILLSNGDVAYCDASDYEIASKQENWCFGDGYPYYTDYSETNKPKTVKLHQLLNPGWEMTDHEDGNRLNNTRSNLRKCTSQQNNANRSGKQGTSRYKGVSMDSSRNKWISSIQINNKTKHIGRFDDEIEAAKAYDKESFAYYGEFAKLNFPKPKMWLMYVSASGNAIASNEMGDLILHIDELPRDMDLLPWVGMKTADNKFVPWLASQTDLLSDDWMIVEP